MSSPEDPKGAEAPQGEGASAPDLLKSENGHPAEPHVSYAPVTDASRSTGSTALVPAAKGGGSGGTPAPPPPPDSEDDGEEDGMLRMSFLEHLEELRSRILRAIGGIGVAFVISLFFCNDLWKIVSAPAVGALKTLGYKGMNGGDPGLMQIAPMDYFNIVWVKLPILTAIFIGVLSHQDCTSANGAGRLRSSSVRPACSSRAACSAILWPSAMASLFCWVSGNPTRLRRWFPWSSISTCLSM
jgi:sec-independent protein translocase protein TatC